MQPTKRSESEPIRLCSGCGRPPAASVQVGTGTMLGWLECPVCGKKTQDGQSFDTARREWNAELFRKPAVQNLT